jgi:hypothetical protein
MTVFLAETPLSFIVLPILPDESSTPVAFSEFVHSLIDAILVLFESFFFEVVGKLTLKQLFFSYEHSFAFHFAIDESASKDAFFCCYYLDIGVADKLLQIKFGIEGCICHQKLI